MLRELDAAKLVQLPDPGRIDHVAELRLVPVETAGQRLLWTVAREASAGSRVPSM